MLNWTDPNTSHCNMNHEGGITIYSSVNSLELVTAQFHAHQNNNYYYVCPFFLQTSGPEILDNVCHYIDTACQVYKFIILGDFDIDILCPFIHIPYPII